MASNKNSHSPRFEEASTDLIQVHQDITYRAAVSSGVSIAVGVGVMAVLGRFAVVYGPKANMLGYLWMTLFVAPLVLTYSERSEAISGPGGVYGLVRNRYGLVVSFLTGWLELGGYAAIIAILARIIVVYSLTLYTAFGGGVFAEGSNPNIKWLTIGVVLLFSIFKISGWHGSRRLNTLLVYSGLLLLAGTAFYSLFSYRGELVGISEALRAVRPLRLSAMLMSSFWGVLMIYVFRRRIIRSQKRTLLQIHWAVSLIVIALGALLAIATLPAVNIDAGVTGVLSTNNFSGIIFVGNEVITALIALFTLIMAFMGLSLSLQGSIEVVSVMTDDAFFPKSFNYRLHRTIFPPMLIVSTLVVFLVLFLETIVIVGMAAALLLWITIFVHAPDIIQPQPKLPPDRPFRLPYHPLFPSLTVVAATVAIFNLGWDNLKWSLLWLGVGGAVLGLYAYRRALQARGKRQTYDDAASGDDIMRPLEKVETKTARQTPTVLAFVHDLNNLPRTISLGRKIAARSNATLTLMQIVEGSEQQPLYVQREQGKKLWEHLAGLVREWESKADGASNDVIIRPIVRMTSDLIEGVINAAQEEHAQFLVLPPDFAVSEPARHIEQYDKVLQLTPGNILFMNQFSSADELKHVTVLVGDGGHASMSLIIADALTAADGVIEVGHYLPPDASAEDEAAARERIKALIHDSDIDDDRADIRILRMATLEEAVQALAQDTDLLLLGASRNFMTRRSTFGGVNAHIFQNSSVPVIMVRAHEKIRFAWLSRLWETITAPLPKLTLDERETVVAEVTSGATPSVDFFVLILLSSGIAMYGLLQNSGAVIIGAMLVAPLMSPIVSMAMSIVRGDIKHLGQGAQATAQGVLMAIFVGALLTFLSPIRQQTNEIMARINPNLLDLGVAFLSGAAGGYAMSRKSIAAALPGVAIAAALVPPLAVVGYGFASADLNIAFGALLLFITNLIAIVLAASLVFLALDFLSPEKQSWGEVVRSLKIILVFLGIVIIILGTVTYRSVKEQHQLAAINKVLDQSLYHHSFEPLDINIKGSLHGYKIDATVLSYDRLLTSDDFTKLGQELESAVGAPVAIDLTSIPAKQDAFTFESAVTPLKIEEAVKEALKDSPVEILDIQVAQVRDGYSVSMAVMVFAADALSQQTVDDMAAQLSEQFNAPVSIMVHKLPAETLKAGGQ